MTGRTYDCAGCGESFTLDRLVIQTMCDDCRQSNVSDAVDAPTPKGGWLLL